MGKFLLVAAPLIGAGPPFLFSLAMRGRLEDYLFNVFWLPMPVAAVAACLVLLESRFSRLFLVGSCLFLVIGPVVAVDTRGGSLHGGEIVIVLHVFCGLLSWVFAVPGLLLWRRRGVTPPLPAL